MISRVKRVAIVGGTHGNERIGVYLLKKFQQFPDLLRRYTSLELMTLLANPKAVEFNRRYIDRDLNRCFSKEDMSNSKLMSYEDIRAKEIAEQLSNADFILDLHSSTANMGLTILPTSKHPFNLRLCAYLSEIDPSVRISLGDGSDNSRLRSLSPLGCAIEVGPLSHGTLNAHPFQQTEMLVHATLNYLDYQENPLSTPSHLTVYQTNGSIDYPRNSVGELQAMIHPQLQFKDYQPLHPGEPMFLTFTGETISYQGESTYPIFINEAAYYINNTALTLTERQRIQIETA